jgi:hypothetical protein
VWLFKTIRKELEKVGGLKRFFSFLLLLIVPLAWRWTPLNEWVNFETIIEWQ